MSGKIPANADRYRVDGCVGRRQLTEALAIVKKKISCATTQIKFHRITSNQVFQIWVVLSFYASLGTMQASLDSPASAVYGCHGKLHTILWKVSVERSSPCCSSLMEPPKKHSRLQIFLKWVEVCLHWLWHVMALCCNVMWQNMNKENQISHLNSHCVEFTWPEALGLWATLNPAKPEATSPDRYRVYWGIFSWRRKPRYLGHVT